MPLTDTFTLRNDSFFSRDEVYFLDLLIGAPQVFLDGTILNKFMFVVLHYHTSIYSYLLLGLCVLSTVSLLSLPKLICLLVQDLCETATTLLLGLFVMQR